MKRALIAALCVLLLALCGGCGRSGSSAGPAPDSSPADAPASSAGPEEASAEESAPTASFTAENSDAIVIESQDCYDQPYCFQPQADGTYHFSARTADDFEGKNAAYDGDAITWDVYILEAAYEADGAWNLLGQASDPAILSLNGSCDLSLKQGEYVYCVCSLNALTGTPAADGAGVLTITPTAEDLTPNEDNNYLIPVTINSETRFDLDGDGDEETIFYSVQSDLPTAGGWAGARPLSMAIDGTEFLHPERENPMEAFGFWMENPDVSHYYIVDLDASDRYLEIAIADQGSNGQSSTHFFRYVDSELAYLGQTSGLPDDHTTVFRGNGTVCAMTPLNVLQSWSGVRTYALEDGQLRLRTGEFCQPVLPEGWNVTLKQAILVYQTPSLDAEVLTLEPDSSSLSFPSTDGEHWVQLVCADGSQGWAYFSDFNTLVSGVIPLEADQVFGNLFLAG